MDLEIKKSRGNPRLFYCLNLLIRICRLKFSHVNRLRSFSSLLFIKSHSLAFAQRLETLTLDGSVMHKNVLSGISFNKTITFLIIEPLYSTFRHFKSFLNCVL